MPRSKEVDAWFKDYDNPMKPVVLRMRAIILGADKRIEECIKWKAPTFVFNGNLASFYPKSKSHASLMFHVGAKIPGKHPRLEGSGDTSRVMKIGSVQEANAAKRDLERIVKAWCEWKSESSKKTAKTTTKSAAKKTTKKAAKKTAKKTTKKTAKKTTKKTAKKTTKKAAKKTTKKAARKATKKKASSSRQGSGRR